MLGLTTCPLACPQIPRLVTGQSPGDPAFRKRRSEFLRAFAAWLGPERATPPLPAGARRGGRP
jgi:hypothetical protein